MSVYLYTEESILAYVKKYIFFNIWTCIHIHYTYKICVYVYISTHERQGMKQPFILPGKGGWLHGTQSLTAQLMPPLSHHSFVHFKCDEIFW